MAASGSSTNRMSSPASATERGLQARALRAAGRRARSRSRRASCTAPARSPRCCRPTTCVYIPSLPGLPLARTLEAVAAIRAAGLDPVPHVSARRILERRRVPRFPEGGRDEARRAPRAADRRRRAEAEGTVHRQPADPRIRAARRLAASARSASRATPRGIPRISNLSRIVREESASSPASRASASTSSPSSPSRRTAWSSTARSLARSAPEVSIYVGVAGPTDPVALARYAQRCGVSVSLRALRTLGSGIARLVTNSDPREQLIALARYSLQREPSNVVGVHLYSFGGAVRTASWMRELI